MSSICPLNERRNWKLIDFPFISVPIQFELKEMKRRQEAAEEAERQRLQAEKDARAAAEAQAEAARQSSRDSHDAPGSPQRESGNYCIYTHTTQFILLSTYCIIYKFVVPKEIHKYSFVYKKPHFSIWTLKFVFYWPLKKIK